MGEGFVGAVAIRRMVWCGGEGPKSSYKFDVMRSVGGYDMIRCWRVDGFGGAFRIEGYE